MKTIKDLKIGDQVYVVYDNHEYRVGTVMEINYPLAFDGRVKSCKFNLSPGDCKFTETFPKCGSINNKNYFYPDDLSGCIAYLEKEDAIEHIKDSINTALKSIYELSAI